MPRLNAAQPITLPDGTMAQPFREFLLRIEKVTLDADGGLSWSLITGTPTTLAGYGITDAATSAQGANADTAHGWGDHSLAGYATTSYVNALTWDFATDITGKPTTLSGYGITDAAPSASPTFTGNVTMPGGAILRDPTGGYGSIEVDGGATGGWEGYSIGGRVLFMHDNASGSGLYNDVDDHWLVYAVNNGSVSLYNAGAAKLATSASGITVTGTGSATVDWTVTSDRRLKKDIARIDNPESLYGLTGYTFTKDGVPSAGVIAQEARRLTPELVHEGEDGFLSVNYNGYVGYLIELLKRQKAQIDELGDRVRVLELKEGMY